MEEDVMIDEMVTEVEGPVPVVTETVGEDTLTRTTTYDAIPTKTEVIDIREIKAKLYKIDSAIAIWMSKRKPLQDVLDKYNALKEEVTEEDPVV